MATCAELPELDQDGTKVTGRGVSTDILESAAKAKLWEILDICLRDQREAWVLEPDGRYEQLQAKEGATGPEGRGTHQTLMDLTRARADV